MQEEGEEFIQLSGNWSETRSIQQGSKNKIRLHDGSSWIHENVWNDLYRRITKTISQAKDTIRWPITIWVHKFIPMPQAMKVQDAKATVDKEWKKLETIPAWNLDKVKSKQRMHVSWRRMSQRDNVWNHFFRKIMKIALQAKGMNRWPMTIWFKSLLFCFKRWKFLRKQQWTRNGRRSRQFQHGSWTK